MGATILVADDESAMLAVQVDSLADAGHRVLAASGDRVAALALIERERPDLHITDDMMPRLGGLALIGRLRARPDLALPNILMSAAPVVAAPRGIALLPKPFGVNALLALVANLLPAN